MDINHTNFFNMLYELKWCYRYESEISAMPHLLGTGAAFMGDNMKVIPSSSFERIYDIVEREYNRRREVDMTEEVNKTLEDKYKPNDMKLFGVPIEDLSREAIMGQLLSMADQLKKKDDELRDVLKFKKEVHNA